MVGGFASINPFKAQHFCLFQNGSGSLFQLIRKIAIFPENPFDNHPDLGAIIIIYLLLVLLQVFHNSQELFPNLLQTIRDFSR